MWHTDVYLFIVEIPPHHGHHRLYFHKSQVHVMWQVLRKKLALTAKKTWFLVRNSLQLLQRRRTHFMLMITSAVNLFQTFYQSSGFSDSGPNRFDILGVSLHWLLIAQCGPHIFCLHLNWSLQSDSSHGWSFTIRNREMQYSWIQPPAAEIVYYADKGSSVYWRNIH